MHQNLLWINFILILLVALSYLLVRRRPRQPSRLNLRKGRRERASGERLDLRLKGEAHSPNEANRRRQERALNVIFTYRDRSWDAYEVLGVPAGSSFEGVRKAYNEKRQRVSGEDLELIDAAFRALQ